MRKKSLTHRTIKPCTGFTLVEIMVTLAVLVIAAAVAAPAFTMMAPNMALKAAARDLYSKLQEAKMLAIKENRRITVRFNGTYYYIDLNYDGVYTPSLTDTFTDTNGDGVYTAGEPFSDLDLNGVYSGEIATSFTDYNYGVNLGTGNAAQNWNGNACNQMSVITFNSRGTSGTGTVFLQNKNNDISFAVTVRTAGSIKTRKYDGTAPFNQAHWD